VPIPVILFDRQPPPSVTARQANEPSRKSCWQNTVKPPAAAALIPSEGQGRPGAGAEAGSAIRVLVVVVEVAADLVVTGAEETELDVGGATVTVVKTMAGRVADAVVEAVVRGGTGFVDVVMAVRLVAVELVALELGLGVDTGAGVVLVVVPGHDAAGDTAIARSVPSVTSPELLIEGIVAVDGAEEETDGCRAR
jgi:hypothetical protein